MDSQKSSCNIVPCFTHFNNLFSPTKQDPNFICPNYQQCLHDYAYCAIKAAVIMADNLPVELDASDLTLAIEKEKQDFLENGPEGKYFVMRQNKWLCVEGKKNILLDIVKFAKIIYIQKVTARKIIDQLTLSAKISSPTANHPNIDEPFDI